MRRHSKTLLARPADLRPEDAPLYSIESRAAARACLVQSRKRIQLIIVGDDDPPTPLNFETSTCERQIWPDGSIFECVMLDGLAEDLTEDQLQAFIDRHPIKRNTTAR